MRQGERESSYPHVQLQSSAFFVLSDFVFGNKHSTKNRAPTAKTHNIQMRFKFAGTGPSHRLTLVRSQRLTYVFRFHQMVSRTENEDACYVFGFVLLIDWLMYCSVDWLTHFVFITVKNLPFRDCGTDNSHFHFRFKKAEGKANGIELFKQLSFRENNCKTAILSCLSLLYIEKSTKTAILFL